MRPFIPESVKKSRSRDAMSGVCLLATVLMLPASLRSDDTTYLEKVKPILHEKCWSCHGVLGQEGSLRLDTGNLIRQGGDSGPAIIPGNAANSLLIERITASDDERMPPSDEGARLSSNEVDILRAWINAGATAPDEKAPESPAEHWAFQPPRRAAVPMGLSIQWAQNPIDAFIAAEHKERGLQPVSLAPASLRLRRAYLDLIGLPPTREELDRFLADPSDLAFRQTIDRLLESPHYGERWGRHWMDIWRYSDWYGLGKQLRYSQKHIWHWRDWIVESLNADKGYDQMVVEMLAADELTPTDSDTLRATGFLARHYYLFNRTTWLDSTIEHTSKAFLGLTMNCAKCHAHKYDPLSHEDYYRMRAIFEPYQVRLDTLPGETDLERNGLPRVFDAHPDAKTYLHVRGDEKNPDTSAALEPGIPNVLAFAPFEVKAVDLPRQAANPALRPFVIDDLLDEARQELKAATKKVEEAEQRLASFEKDSPSAEREEPKPFLADRFDTLDEEVWDIGPGDWTSRDGLLVQKASGGRRAWLRTRTNHPPSFEAVLRFTTTGGDKWRSVGLAFDVTDGDEKLIYLSAVSPGSKLQAAYRTGGKQTYPSTARVPHKVKLNQRYEMKIAVHDSLVNVSIDGERQLAYEFPVPRQPGKLDLVAFDAEVEFDALEVRPLPQGTRLVPPGQDELPTRESREAELALARASMTIVEKQIGALQAAHAADVAKAAAEQPANLSDIIRAAALAQRKVELAEAEHALLVARQQKVSEKKTQKQIDEAIAKAVQGVEAARTALEDPGEVYEPVRASLKALEGPDEKPESRNAPYPAISTGRRTAFARWITDRRNPLAARVAVNHIWLRHFGQPLVDPVDDFGLRTPAPPQQDLLDWLAVELMENGWSLKHLHRLILTSRTWQLSSSARDADAQTVKRDPNNAFYWRRLPVRMESQIVRDSLVYLAGELDLQVGGPSLDTDATGDVFRRSLYFKHSRDDQHPLLVMFDDADILACYRRSESVVPQQALALANSRLALGMSRKTARRLNDALGDASDEEFVEAAYQLILCMNPTDQEQDFCLKALQDLRAAVPELASDEATRRARAGLVHALFNHNDFITIR